jgi:hypothetical protein
MLNADAGKGVLMYCVLSLAAAFFYVCIVWHKWQGGTSGKVTQIIGLTRGRKKQNQKAPNDRVVKGESGSVATARGK